MAGPSDAPSPPGQTAVYHPRWADRQREAGYTQPGSASPSPSTRAASAAAWRLSLFRSGQLSTRRWGCQRRPGYTGEVDLQPPHPPMSPFLSLPQAKGPQLP